MGVDWKAPILGDHSMGALGELCMKPTSRPSGWFALFVEDFTIVYNCFTVAYKINNYIYFIFII